MLTQGGRWNKVEKMRIFDPMVDNVKSISAKRFPRIGFFPTQDGRWKPARRIEDTVNKA